MGVSIHIKLKILRDLQHEIDKVIRAYGGLDAAMRYIEETETRADHKIVREIYKRMGSDLRGMRIDYEKQLVAFLNGEE